MSINKIFSWFCFFLGILVIIAHQIFFGGMIELLRIPFLKLEDMKKEVGIITAINSREVLESKSITRYQTIYDIELTYNLSNKVVISIPNYELKYKIDDLQDLRNILMDDTLRIFYEGNVSTKKIYQIENTTDNTILISFEEAMNQNISNHLFMLFLSFFLISISYLIAYPKFLGKFRRE